MKPVTLLDLFSGIGGFPLGLLQAGFKFRKHYFSEIDKYAIANYQNNFKKAIHVGAVEEITSKTVERPDIITFGSPCQNLSLAGKREGIHGEKSKLFFEAVRIIDELKPRLFVFENVKGLFSSNQGKDFEIVLRSFANLGIYDIQWQLLNTSWFLPQNRERVYLVGSLGRESRPEVFPLKEIIKTNHEGSKKSKLETQVAPTIAANYHKMGNSSTYVFAMRGRKDGSGQNAEFRKDKSSNCITASNKHNLLVNKWSPLRSVRTEKAKAIRRKNQKMGVDYAPFSEKEYQLNTDGLIGTIMKNGERENLVTNLDQIRKLTPLECERLQGFPDHWTTKGLFENEVNQVSDTQRYQLLGNAVSVPVVKAVGLNLLKSLSQKKKTRESISPLDGLSFVKTPVTFYGGKQRMVKLILSLIPSHKLFCEPFIGGAAVFFAKEPSEIEVINDLDSNVVNFYQTCHDHFLKLNKLIQRTPHSRQIHREAHAILKSTENIDSIKLAWAFWVQTSLSFSSKIFGGYAYERKSNKTVRSFVNKKLRFDESVKERLDNVSIENNDALKVIKSRDTKESFFYCDPPYFNSDMGHYSGYTEQDFENLLKLLSQIKGKFLLSSYPSELLDKYIKKNKWQTISKSMFVSVNRNSGEKPKTEVLTANYPISISELNGLMNDKPSKSIMAKQLYLKMLLESSIQE